MLFVGCLIRLAEDVVLLELCLCLGEIGEVFVYFHDFNALNFGAFLILSSRLNGLESFSDHGEVRNISKDGIDVLYFHFFLLFGLRVFMLMPSHALLLMR